MRQGLSAGIEVGCDGVITDVTGKIEKDMSALEVVRFQIDAQEVVRGRVLPGNGQGGTPVGIPDAQFDVFFNFKSGSGGNGDDPAGGLGKGQG